MLIRVNVIQGPHNGDSFKITRSETIGRLRRCAISLPADEKVSREHAMIIVYDKTCYVEDCESSNGTFVGAERISARVELKRGQIVGVGKSLLQLDW